MRLALPVCLVAVLALLPMNSAAAAPADSNAFAEQVLALTNAERQSAGMPPLALSRELADAAQNYSQVLASTDCFAHTCGPVPDFADRDGQAGYNDWTSIGENIAAGSPTPDDVVAQWMASPGHRANILSPNYTEIGVCVATGSGRFGTYWTQEFGSRD